MSEHSPLSSEISQAEAKLGLDIPPFPLWNIRPEDIQYLQSRWPFLQVGDTKACLGAPEKVGFITAQSGWQICDYGHALSSSLGRLLFGGGYFKVVDNDDDSEGGTSDGGGVINSGKGTLINQAFLTASDMVRIADERLWEGLFIIDGSPFMRWVAWVEAYDRGFVIEGYEPSKEDFDKRRLIRMDPAGMDAIRSGIKPRG